jgi:hypothetical protein
MGRVLVGIGLAILVGLAVREAIAGSMADVVMASAAFVAGSMGLALTLRRSGSTDDSLGGKRHGWPAIERELSRSRRKERTFSLARLTPTQELAEPSKSRVLRAMQRSIRDIDAAWWAGSDILLMLSETSSSSVGPLIGRLQAAVPSAGFGWTVAEFPRDGLTLPALLSVLADDESVSAAQLEVSDGAL